jgi:hypothetical protein
VLLAEESGTGATANCRDDVHARLLPNGRVEFRALLVQVHVNVATELRSRLAQAISQPRPFALEVVDELADGVPLHVELPRQPREERSQGRREMDVGDHSIVATSIDAIGGR